LAAPKTARVNVEGLVLARNVGYDDCVRRALATDAIAIPTDETDQQHQA
jgi:hypothetical protein